MQQLTLFKKDKSMTRKDWNPNQIATSESWERAQELHKLVPKIKTAHARSILSKYPEVLTKARQGVRINRNYPHYPGQSGGGKVIKILKASPPPYPSGVAKSTTPEDSLDTKSWAHDPQELVSLEEALEALPVIRKLGGICRLRKILDKLDGLIAKIGGISTEHGVLFAAADGKLYSPQE